MVECLAQVLASKCKKSFDIGDIITQTRTILRTNFARSTSTDSKRQASNCSICGRSGTLVEHQRCQIAALYLAYHSRIVRRNFDGKEVLAKKPDVMDAVLGLPS